MTLAEVQQLKKGSVLELSSSTQDLDVDFYCHKQHLFSSSYENLPSFDGDEE